MATTITSKNTMNLLAHVPKKALVISMLTTGTLLASSLALASGEWEISPAIKVATTYSDNIDRNVSEDSDVALEITPSVGITRDTRRLQLTLDYSLQNLNYFDESSRNTTNHRLFSDIVGELVEKTLFIDFDASVRQQLIDRTSDASGDTISGGANVSDVYTYSISPYWQEQLGNILEWDLRYTHDSVNTEESGNDSEGNGVTLSVLNGSGTRKLGWDLYYDKKEVDYDDGGRSDTEVLDAQINYLLTNSLSAVVTATEEDFEFVGDRGDSTPDDSTYGGGLTWAPSDDFSTTILYNERRDPRPGEDSNFISADLFWAPTARTDISLSYGNRFFGETYNGTLTHRTRWTRWNFSYDEGVSDFRTLAQDIGFFACPVGVGFSSLCRPLESGEAPGPGEELANVASINTSITEDTFINKRGNASVSIIGARNTVTLSATNARRTFVADGESERDTILDLSWIYEIAPRTDSTVRVTDSSIEFDNSESDDIMRYSWRVTRRVGASSIFYVETQFYDRESNVASRNYDETRFTVSFEKSF